MMTPFAPPWRIRIHVGRPVLALSLEKITCAAGRNPLNPRMKVGAVERLCDILFPDRVRCRAGIDWDSLQALRAASWGHATGRHAGHTTQAKRMPMWGQRYDR